MVLVVLLLTKMDTLQRLTAHHDYLSLPVVCVYGMVLQKPHSNKKRKKRSPWWIEAMARAHDFLLCMQRLMNRVYNSQLPILCTCMHARGQHVHDS